MGCPNFVRSPLRSPLTYSPSSPCCSPINLLHPQLQAHACFQHAEVRNALCTAAIALGLTGPYPVSAQNSCSIKNHGVGLSRLRCSPHALSGSREQGVRVPTLGPGWAVDAPQPGLVALTLIVNYRYHVTSFPGNRETPLASMG